MDSSVSVTVNDKIRHWIRTVLTHDSLPEDVREDLRKYGGSRRNKDDSTKTIPFSLLKKVFVLMKDENEDTYLHELMAGCDIQFPEREVVPRNPELEARIQRLKVEEQNKAYAQMVRNVDTQGKAKDTVTWQTEIKAVNRHLITVLNFVLTVVGAFVFGYKATQYSLSTPDFTMQVCVGLVTASIVFIADMYFIMKNTL